MSAAKCGVCQKTAYPLESIVALEKTYHKGCFKCTVCKSTLNIKNFKGVEGLLYCGVHTPKATATQVADSVAMKTALNAPKKVSEGLGTAQKGSGERPNVGLDSMATKNALNAPKKVSEGLGNAQKGTGGKPTYTVFGGDANAQPSGHEEQHYGGGEEQHQQYEEQQYEEQQYGEEQQQYGEEQQYEEQQYGEEQQYEEQQYDEQYQ